MAEELEATEELEPGGSLLWYAAGVALGFVAGVAIVRAIDAARGPCPCHEHAQGDTQGAPGASAQVREWRDLEHVPVIRRGGDVLEPDPEPTAADNGAGT